MATIAEKIAAFKAARAQVRQLQNQFDQAVQVMGQLRAALDAAKQALDDAQSDLEN